MYTIADSYAARVAPTCAAMAGGEVRTKPMNGKTAFMFPCPFCSPTRTKASNRKKRCAILMPRADKSYCYTFSCANDRCGKVMNFHQFLESFNGSLARQYKRDLMKKDSKKCETNLRNIFKESHENLSEKFEIS